MWILTHFTRSGEPEIGLSPTVKIRDVATTVVVVSGASMSEQGDGFYRYDFSLYNSDIDYSIICDSVTLSGTERYTYASSGEYNEVLDSIESTVGVVDIRTILLRKIQTNRLELFDGDTDNWILYDDDAVTPLLTFDVTDKDGGLIVQCPSAPSKRSGVDGSISGSTTPDIYMRKSVYDSNDNGYVNNTENVSDGTCISTACEVRDAVDDSHSPFLIGTTTIDETSISGGTGLIYNASTGNLEYNPIITAGHGDLSGLGDDDHTQYILADGTRAFTGNIKANASGTLDIGSLALPFKDLYLTGSSLYMNGDKVLYMSGNDLVLDSPSGNVVVSSGVSPTAAQHLTTKNYVDSQYTTISGDLSAEIDANITAHAAIDTAHHTKYTDEEAQDTIGSITSGAGSVTVTYDDTANTLTISGAAASVAGADHSTMSNLDYASTGHTGFLSTTQFTVSSGDLQTNIDALTHDGFADFVTNEHLDWTTDLGADNMHDGNIVASNVTQHEGSIDHDALTNFATDEHFTEVSIDHGTISGIGDDDHTQYILADGTRALTGTWNYGAQDISGAGSIFTTGNMGVGTSSTVARLEIEDGGTGHQILLKVTQDDQGTEGIVVSNDTYSTNDLLGINIRQRDTGESVIGNATNNTIVMDVSGGIHLSVGSQFVNEFSTDDTMAGNSDTAVPTEKATKTYVDDQITTATGSLTGNDITMERIAGSTFSTAQHMQDIFHSSGWSSGGAITSGTVTTVDVAAGTGFIRDANSSIATIFYFDWDALSALSVPTNTIRYIGVEYNSGSPQAVVRSSYNWNFFTDFPLGSVVNENNTLHILNATHAIGDHASNMINRNYETMPLKRDDRAGGLIIGEEGTRNISLTTGALWERLERFTISAISTSGTDTFDRYYQDGSGGWTKEPAQTQWNNTQYDDGDGGLQTISNNKYSTQYFYIELDGDMVSLYGRAQYNSLALAQDDTPPSTVPDRLTDHGKLIGRIVFKESGASAALVESVFDTSFSTTLVTDHGNLAGLSDDDHTQYLLIDGTRAMTGNLDIDDTDKLRLGTGNDLTLYHNGSNTYIDNLTGSFYLRNAGTENAIVMVPNGAVSLYYDAALKLSTSALGVQVDGAVTSTSLVADTLTLGGGDPMELFSIDDTLSGESDIAAVSEKAIKIYVDDKIIDHGGLVGLSDDDHPQYVNNTEMTTISGDIVSQISGIANVVEDTTPQLGGDLDTNNFSIEIDAVPGSDHEATGTITTMTLGESVVFGEVLYIKTDGELGKSDASSTATMPVFAMSIATTSSGASGQVLLSGFVRDDTYTNTIGGEVFGSTSGTLTQTAPTGSGDQVQYLGIATHADRMFFNPDLGTAEVA